MPRNEDEKHDQAYTDEYRHEQDHYSTLVHKFADVWLSDTGPVHEGVLAEAGKGKDGIDTVLLRRKCIDADGEREDEL